MLAVGSESRADKARHLQHSIWDPGSSAGQQGRKPVRLGLFQTILRECLCLVTGRQADKARPLRLVLRPWYRLGLQACRPPCSSLSPKALGAMAALNRVRAGLRCRPCSFSG